MTEGDRYICTGEHWCVPTGTIGIAKWSTRHKEWTLKCDAQLPDTSFKVTISYELNKHLFKLMED